MTEQRNTQKEIQTPYINEFTDVPHTHQLTAPIEFFFILCNVLIKE